MGSERRRYRRVRKPFSGVFKASVGGRVVIADLSPGGCFIEAKSPLEPGTETVVTIRTETRELVLKARVAYAVPGTGFGVEFVSPTSEERTYLAWVVEEASADPVLIDKPDPE